MASSSLSQLKGAGTGETVYSSSSIEAFPQEPEPVSILYEAECVKRANLEEEIAVLEARAGRQKQVAEEAAVLSGQNAATRRKIASANADLLVEQDSGMRMQRQRQEALRTLRADADNQKMASSELAARQVELQGSCEVLQAQRQALVLRAEALAEERTELEAASQQRTSQSAAKRVDEECKEALASAELSRRNITSARQEKALEFAKLEAERSLGFSTRKAELEAECSAKLTELEARAAVERGEAQEINERLELSALEVSKHKQGIDHSDDLVREFDGSGKKSLKDDKANKVEVDDLRKQLAAANDRAAALQRQQKVLQERRDTWRQGTAVVFAALVAMLAVAFLVAKDATAVANQ